MTPPEDDWREQFAPYARTYSIRELQEMGREFTAPRFLFDQVGRDLKCVLLRRIPCLRDYFRSEKLRLREPR